MRIMIGVPSFDERSVFSSVYKALWDMDKCGHEVLFEPVSGYDCATARNRIAQKALDLETDYVLMIDSDVTVPRDLLEVMLDEPVDVCLGYYAHRDADNIYRGRTSVCKLHDENYKAYFNYPLESEYAAAELKKLREDGEKKHRIHGGGMGCAMIRTEVFRIIEYPWYDWVNYKGENRGMLSEDLYFCEQCRFHGIPIHTDTRAACGHMLRRNQWPE